MNCTNICFKAKSDNKRYLLKQRLRQSFSPRHCFFIAITSGAHGPSWLLCQLFFFYESSQHQNPVKHQSRDNTSIDHTVTSLHSFLPTIPEEESQRFHSLLPQVQTLLGVLLYATFGNLNKDRAVNETSISKGHGSQPGHCCRLASAPDFSAQLELWGAPGTISKTHLLHLWQILSPKMPGGRVVRATASKAALQL